MQRRPSWNMNVLLQVHAWERAKAELKSMIWCMKISPEMVDDRGDGESKDQQIRYKKFEKKVKALISFYETEMLGTEASMCNLNRKDLK